MSTAAVELRGVGKAFGSVNAIADIDLTIDSGEFVVFVGPSGCGKTTLLRAITGLTSYTGSISVAGVEPSVAKSNGHFGWVFQDPVLLPWRTVERNIGLPAELLARGRHSSVHDLITMLGLAGFGRALPRTLSGGMRSRVAIARALSFQPSVLVMDEPFAALDEPARIAVQRDLLQAVATTGATTLFVTHSLAEAVLLGDRVIVMSQRPGRVKLDMPISVARDARRAFAATTQFGEFLAIIRDALDSAIPERQP